MPLLVAAFLSVTCSILLPPVVGCILDCELVLGFPVPPASAFLVVEASVLLAAEAVLF
jgi:hypothetical protein